MMKQKCCECKKKVQYFGIKCRCTDVSGERLVFCSVCIAVKMKESDTGHKCSFDYKQLSKDNITKSNPTVQFTKIESI
jgi:hypothetical protein